ncbi:hypothetical protein AKJ09_00325 [Labilithrix luteola]|uniref:Uncharacterized protein n=1 Tax=Labilithrix luteola TaxID=1391654 RepID=A0A0K1PJS0_9BACT|nr:hypothetical protein [Labilithrix luteola]AKU93661.1 hypothetical protein AKJ09_00325 [Labilithrix luteola]
MSELSPDERKFLDAVRPEWGPRGPFTPPSSSDMRERLLEKPWLARSGATSTTARIVLALSALGVCSVAVVLSPKLVSRRGAEEVNVTSLPAPTAHAPETPPMAAVTIDSLPDAPTNDQSLPSEKAMRAKVAPVRAAVSSTRPNDEVDPLAFELRLVRSAQGALRADDPGRALGFLETHASHFPSGTLRDERMTLQVLARCALGEVSTARAIKSELERLSPGSSHLQRLSNSCAR